MKIKKLLSWYYLVPITLIILFIVGYFLQRKKSKIGRKKGKNVSSFKVNTLNYVPRALPNLETYQEPINYPRIRDPEILNRDIVYDFEPEDINFHERGMNFVIREDDILIHDADSQNVHDNKVQRYITTEYKDFLKDNVKDTEKELEIIKENLMNLCINEHTRGQLSKVIDRIKERDAHVSSLDQTESQVLVHTYRNVKNDPDTLDALKQNLYACIENGAVVCPTGVVSRIISSKLLNPEDAPKTENEINQEIYITAGNIMKNLEENDPDFKQKFHKMLESKLKQDYSDILTKEEIHKKAEELTRNLY